MYFLLLTIGNGVDHLESNEYYKKLLNMAVLAGSIMISSGAETHRVEDTLHRILGTTHFEHADAFVFTTGMVVTLSDPSAGRTGGKRGCPAPFLCRIPDPQGTAVLLYGKARKAGGGSIPGDLLRRDGNSGEPGRCAIRSRKAVGEKLQDR